MGVYVTTLRLGHMLLITLIIMKQFELLNLCNTLKPNHWIILSYEDIAEAAMGEVGSHIFNNFRLEDLNEFISKIEKNWGIEVRNFYEAKEYRLFKPPSKVFRER